jgi:hypothetical protein
MTKVIIELDGTEYAAFLSKLNGRTQRETVLDALGIPCVERRMGRPTNDEMTALRERIEAARQQRADDEARARWEQALKDQAKEMKRLGLDEG